MGVAKWGHEVCVRVALAAARAALPVYERTYVLSTLCRDTLDAAETWLDARGQAPLPPLFEPPENAGRKVSGAASAALRVVQTLRADPGDLRTRQRKLYRTKQQIAARFCFLAVNDARAAIGLEAVRDAIRRDVGNWALSKPSS